MSNRTDTELLRDILEAIRRISSYVGRMSYETFMDDDKTQDAVIRNLEIIGEAAKNLSQQLRTENSSVPWKAMAGIRDRLIHQYFGVNVDIVWEVITSELPGVTSLIERIIEE
jgi:uncharacterized protein with HEPN domain